MSDGLILNFNYCRRKFIYIYRKITCLAILFIARVGNLYLTSISPARSCSMYSNTKYKFPHPNGSLSVSLTLPSKAKSTKKEIDCHIESSTCAYYIYELNLNALHPSNSRFLLKSRCFCAVKFSETLFREWQREGSHAKAYVL